MLYEDINGRIFHPEEVESLSMHEIEDMEIHVYDCRYACV